MKGYQELFYDNYDVIHTWKGYKEDSGLILGVGLQPFQGVGGDSPVYEGRRRIDLPLDLLVPNLHAVDELQLVVGELAPGEGGPGGVGVGHLQAGLDGYHRRQGGEHDVLEGANGVHATGGRVVHVAQVEGDHDLVLPVLLQADQVELQLGRGNQVAGRGEALLLPGVGVVVAETNARGVFKHEAWLYLERLAR